MKANIRKAVTSDIKLIHKLLKPYATEGLILERKVDDIAEELDKFFVAENKSGLIGVISYYDYGRALKEVRSLAVKRQFFRKKLGSLLLKTLVESLLEHYPETKIFTLSYSPKFFQKNGFVAVDKKTLPEKIWKDCRYCKDYDKCGETALVLSKKRHS
ncbi:MAG: GNAT family N-acetyltransferase [Spirochaetes bacterium]|jgi:amino-acid N-acetyltransferase|nr:GNAT family N-acetyltransferase [Spirochaetota bacterium]